MAISKEKKEQFVQEYVNGLQNSSAVVFVRSRGLSVAEVSDLRNRIRETGGKYTTIKNTLFRLALGQAEMPIPDTISGPLSVVLCPEDIALSVKAVQDFAKTLGEREFAIVGGIVGSDVLDAQRADALASLPSKDMLFAQILAGINAPGSQLLGVVANGVRQVLNVLQARVDQLQEGEAAA